MFLSFWIYLFPHLLCSFTLLCKDLHVSPVYGFPHSHVILYMQFFDSCVWFGGLVLYSMLRSVGHDLKAVLIPYLLPILFNFSYMPGATRK